MPVAFSHMFDQKIVLGLCVDFLRLTRCVIVTSLHAFLFTCQATYGKKFFQMICMYLKRYAHLHFVGQSHIAAR